jgi:hypothetical protein
MKGLNAAGIAVITTVTNAIVSIIGGHTKSALAKGSTNGSLLQDNAKLSVSEASRLD